MAAEGHLFALAEDSYWLDTGTPEAFLRANFDLLDGTRPGPPCADAVCGAGGVWRAGEARLDGWVDGASFVGPRVVVESGARATRSVLGAGSILSSSAQVRDSVLLAGAAIGSGAKVLGAIIGARAVVGEGAEVRPGSVIGFEAQVAPRSVADGRVPA